MAASVVVLATAVVSACGSGATSGPGDDDSIDRGLPDPTDGDESGGRTPGGDPDLEFSFRLPEGPVGPTGQDDPVHVALREHGCDAGEQALARVRADLDDPRTALLYEAAIHLCRGEHDLARRPFGQVGLPLWPQACPWYRAVASVLWQQDPSSVSCPAEDDRPDANEGDPNRGDPNQVDPGGGETDPAGDG